MAVETPEPSSLARYVPRLSAEWELHTSESWREIDGTLCYIDISGFTALSEKLARRGRIGAEELTEVLNFVFGKMLGVAYDRGGSLLKFGGDALLLVFRGEDHPLQACSAAVEMQAVLREARSYETSAGRLYLKMSVGLHSGTVHLFRVGGSHNELILTGPAASMTTQMEETAVAGQILISSTTKAAIPAGVALKASGDGWILSWRKARIEGRGWSPRVALQPEAIAAGMPVALRDYLQYGAAEPEHRIATVGFIQYHGVDALMEDGGPQAVGAALDELVRNVQEAVDEEGVTFLASDIDQDGGKIILVAGVPGAQEDDEGRVLRAARRIADSAGTLQLRIGINQGHVFVGEIGTDFRAAYTIMGDTVNLAARLMAAASPGEIYASPSVLDRSRTLFETTALEPFYVKGKEQPVQAYAVGAEGGSRQVDRTNELPFVGRVEEVSQLGEAIGRLEQGSGGAMTVFGETGIGKSRLVDQVFPLPQGVHHVNIRSEPYGTATTYRPLRDPVRDLLGVERGPQAEMAAQLMEAIKAIDPTLVAMLPLIAEVAMIEVDPTPQADAIEPRFLQDRTADVLINVFERVIAGPVLFEAEDGHWMDEASVHILQRIVQATAERPWLVIATRRDETSGFDAGGAEIRLGPLLDDEARELIIKATEAAPLRPHELAAIVERAGGLPLFLEEIIGAVREAGGVDSLPDSLDALVAAQIDALPPLPRRLLRYASVLGRSFRTATLNNLIADEKVELDSVTRTQLLGFLDLEGDDRMRFKHALLRDVAYSGLSFRRRRELHLRAGELAERTAGTDIDSVVDVLALHFSRGGDHEKTWRYARIAGDQAKESYANVDAAVFYQSALESARRLVDVAEAERAGVWTDLGDVRERAGLFAEALDAYHRAERLVKEDNEAVLELILKRSNVHRSSGAYSAALRETARGKRLEYRSGDEGVRAGARLSVERSAIRRWQQRPDLALQLAEEAAGTARAKHDSKTLGRSLDIIDWANRMLGRTSEPVHYEETLAIFEELEDLGRVSSTMNNLGAHAYWEGRWDDAIEAYRHSRDVELRRGNDVEAAIGAANIGELLINQMNLDEAEDLLRDAIRVLHASNHAPAAIFAESELARLLIRRADFGAAEALLEDLKERSRQAGEPMSVLNVSIQQADTAYRQGNPETAMQLLDDATAEAGGMARVFTPTLTRLRGCCLAELGMTAEALLEVEAGLEVARGQDLLYDQALLLSARNEISAGVGLPVNSVDKREADRLLDEMGIHREPVLSNQPL